jgi:hypothetical protein
MQILIYFLFQRASGRRKSEAIRSFLATPLCRSMGDRLTVGDVWGWADFAYIGDDRP